MSSKKPSQNISSSKGRPPLYIKPKEHEGDQVQVMARIPCVEKERFEAARKVLQAKGFDMELSRVIRDALANAAAYVDKTYGPQSASDKSATPKGEELVPEVSAEVLADVRYE